MLLFLYLIYYLYQKKVLSRSSEFVVVDLQWMGYNEKTWFDQFFTLFARKVVGKTSCINSNEDEESTSLLIIIFIRIFISYLASFYILKQCTQQFFHSVYVFCTFTGNLCKWRLTRRIKFKLNLNIIFCISDDDDDNCLTCLPATMSREESRFELHFIF